MCVCVGGGGGGGKHRSTLYIGGRRRRGGGGRRERGQSTRDGQIGIEKCIRVHVCIFSVCLCARVCACRCVNMCACMHGKCKLYMSS